MEETQASEPSGDPPQHDTAVAPWAVLEAQRNLRGSGSLNIQPCCDDQQRQKEKSRRSQTNMPTAFRLDLVLEALCAFLSPPQLHGQFALVCSEWLAAAVRGLQRHCEPHQQLIEWTDHGRRVNTEFSEQLREVGMGVPATSLFAGVIEYPGDEVATNAIMVAKFRARAFAAEVGHALLEVQHTVVRQLRDLRRSAYFLQLIARQRALRLDLATDVEAYDRETAEMGQQLRDCDARLASRSHHCNASMAYLQERRQDAQAMVRRVTALYDLPSANMGDDLGMHDHDSGSDADTTASLPAEA